MTIVNTVRPAILKACLTDGKAAAQTGALTSLQQEIRQDPPSGVQNWSWDGPSQKMERSRALLRPH